MDSSQSRDKELKLICGIEADMCSRNILLKGGRALRLLSVRKDDENVLGLTNHDPCVRAYFLKFDGKHREMSCIV